jgi:hypothetical protein
MIEKMLSELPIYLLNTGSSPTYTFKLTNYHALIYQYAQQPSSTIMYGRYDGISMEVTTSRSCCLAPPSDVV